ncbi:MAG: RNA-binding transcriptional accessory protein [Chitinispirillaceae bacterium]|nr:RNA-binding transcriptional accessory protein [Chitinispirillaceae bacterium]
MDIAAQLITDFGFQPFQVTNTLALIDEGATVPFIARYRKERTGSLDELQLRDLFHKYAYYRELDERRETILSSIAEQGKLTQELEKRIKATLNKTELEDLYLPYKPKRTTRATKAKEAGLEPLSRFLVELTDADTDLLESATAYLNPEKEIDTPQKALQGACDILAEELSDDAENRKWMRELAADEGVITCAVKKEFEGKKTKYEMYYDFKENVRTLPSHRVLAMLRGEREKVLRLSLEVPRETAQRYLTSKLIVHKGSGAEVLLDKTVADSFERLILPATETEIRKELREKAEEEAFKVFGANLQALLVAPPAGRKAVLGLDPGFRTGCKVAVVDDTGKFIENVTIYPHEPQKRITEAEAEIDKLIDTYSIRLIAIGNGTASRETDDFIRTVLEKYPLEARPLQVIVSEAGASVYSASDVAIKEFPDLDLTVRGAISIARRLQDPLSELVKIDPKAIGVGQYQHDVNQAKLRESLDEVVESCVNSVGVDLNLASEELLKYVSGLNRLIASNIVSYRNQHGAFGSRDDLLQVPGLGNKKYQLAAGFLRIPGAQHPLDNSAVHPERYDLVAAMAKALSVTVAELVGNGTAVRKIDKKKFLSDEVGLPTIEDILDELEKPGRDPRAEFTYARFNDAVTKIEDLSEGMQLEGTVTNVTNFGAFVDIGVHQDGLVHISQMADTFVSDPKKVVSVGQVVRVQVVKVDAELKRIALSMKKQTGPSAGKTGTDRHAPGAGRSAEIQKGGSMRHHKDGGTDYRAPKKLKMYKPKFNIKQIMP